MKKILFVITIAIVFSGCSTSCSEQLKKLYTKNQKALTQRKDVNGFTLSMSFLPSKMLPGAKDTATTAGSAFYYFRLQVQCPPSDARANTTVLNYGTDSLFYGADSSSSLPELVEPVITGRQRHYEYLLVFPVEAFDKKEKLRVHFLDRLFTNTKLAFDFERSIIEEIETLSCYATKA